MNSGSLVDIPQSRNLELVFYDNTAILEEEDLVESWIERDNKLHVDEMETLIENTIHHGIVHNQVHDQEMSRRNDINMYDGSQVIPSFDENVFLEEFS